MHPPDGPPVWAALKVPPSGTPPPISSTISRSEMPIGTSIRPVLPSVAGEGEHLGPRDSLGVPIERTSRRRWPMIAGTLARVSTLLIIVGRPNRPPLGRIRRAQPGCATAALDRRHERRLLAADERSGADADLDLEVEVGLEDATAEQAAAACRIGSPGRAVRPPRGTRRGRRCSRGWRRSRTPRSPDPR